MCEVERTENLQELNGKIALSCFEGRVELST
jgi:hypothetical protein